MPGSRDIELRNDSGPRVVLLSVQDHPLIDPLYLRERAKEFRAHAQHAHDEEAKRLMLNLAESYENLARRAEERSSTQEGA
jgi:hypothetical protein